MADDSRPTPYSSSVKDALQDLANELGPNIPDDNAALRAIGDAFRAADPVDRANQLAEAYANSVIPNGDPMTRYGLSQQELMNRAITQGGALNPDWLGPVGGNAMIGQPTLEELCAINAATMRKNGATAAEIEAMWQDMKQAAAAHTDPPECFIAGTLIDMWPLSAGTKPQADGTYDEDYVLSKIWQKPIEEIRPDELVLSYDKKGNLKPGRVIRTFTNDASHILDFWGTGVTPGHVYLCGSGKFEGQHVPIMDILRTDGAVVDLKGKLIRAATACEVGSAGDKLIHTVVGDTHFDGRTKIKESGQIRLGTRLILETGQDVSVSDMITANGGVVTDDGFIIGGTSGQKMPFRWTYSEHLPNPEDYILNRSGVDLEAIYLAGEWESIGTRLAPPAGTIDLSSSSGSSASAVKKPNLQYGGLNRKQRKAMEAKQRKTARGKKRVTLH